MPVSTSRSTYEGQRSSDLAVSLASISRTALGWNAARDSRPYSSATRASITTCVTPPFSDASEENGAPRSKSTRYVPACDAIRIGSDATESAIDDERLAGQIRVLAAHEPRHEGGDFVRRAEPPRRHPGGQFRNPRVAKDAARQVGVDEAGRDAVGEHVVGRHFGCQRGRHPV